jgi:hypothetical protein
MVAQGAVALPHPGASDPDFATRTTPVPTWADATCGTVAERIEASASPNANTIRGTKAIRHNRQLIVDSFGSEHSGVDWIVRRY